MSPTERRLAGSTRVCTGFLGLRSSPHVYPFFTQGGTFNRSSSLPHLGPFNTVRPATCMDFTSISHSSPVYTA
jgi:hypothetical protein